KSCGMGNQSSLQCLGSRYRYTHRRNPARCIPKISNQRPPIADLEYPYTFSAITGIQATKLFRNTACAHTTRIDSAECIRMFQIGDRRSLIADPPWFNWPYNGETVGIHSYGKPTTVAIGLLTSTPTVKTCYWLIASMTVPLPLVLQYILLGSDWAPPRSF